MTAVGRLFRIGLPLIGIMVAQIGLRLVQLVVTVAKFVAGGVGLLCSGPAALALVAVLILAGRMVVARLFFGHWPAVYTVANFAHDYARWFPQMLISTILNASAVLGLLVVTVLVAVAAYCLVIAAIWLGRIGDALARGVLIVADDKRNLRTVEAAAVAPSQKAETAAT